MTVGTSLISTVGGESSAGRRACGRLAPVFNPGPPPPPSPPKVFCDVQIGCPESPQPAPQQLEENEEPQTDTAHDEKQMWLGSRHQDPDRAHFDMGVAQHERLQERKSKETEDGQGEELTDQQCHVDAPANDRCHL